MASLGRGSAIAIHVLLLLACVACSDSTVEERAGAGGGVEPAVSREVPAELRYVTTARCAECHAVEFQAWRGSHHDRAIEEPNEDSVVGDFSGVDALHGLESWHFAKEGGRFVVRAPDAAGAAQQHEVRFTFGFDPLQQYLVEGEGGRLQALTMAWDARAAEEGGQRWYPLAPAIGAPHGDVVHWTGAANRWNSQCADCHSTGLERNYDAASDRFDTKWAELDVACEACHGPGSSHVAWAEGGGGEVGAGSGFPVSLAREPNLRWVMDPARGIARREPPPDPSSSSRVELDTCAPCHSRRSPIAEPEPGGSFLDAYQPALLDEGLYFADGQIDGEVYVYGSFVQSRMFEAGVRCSDCHDPHSLSLRAEGNALCAQCHDPTRFAVPAHHGHPSGSEGARCVSCHMPSRTYMGVDDRRDHSFRVPRPEWSEPYGTPNPCTSCHADRDADWAVGRIASWTGRESLGRPSDFAPFLAAARDRDPTAAVALRSLAARHEVPSIARATAVAGLAGFPGGETAETIGQAARDEDPLVRAAAARAADALPVGERARRLGRLLRDPVRVVRIEAARALAPVPGEALDAAARRARDRALREYRSAQLLRADEPSAHVNLALLALSQGDGVAAERAYRRALEVGDYFLPAYVNLADLYLRSGRDTEGEVLLRKALEIAPDSPDVHHAYGLWLVRQKRSSEALDSLRRAAEGAPDSARYAYVYGVALLSAGDAEEALGVFEAALARHPGDLSLLEVLFTTHRDLGHEARAAEALERLEALRPRS